MVKPRKVGDSYWQVVYTLLGELARWIAPLTEEEIDDVLFEALEPFKKVPLSKESAQDLVNLVYRKAWEKQKEKDNADNDL